MRLDHLAVSLSSWSALLALACTPPPGEEQHGVFASTIALVEVENGTRAVVASIPRDSLRAPRVFVGLYVGYGTAAEAAPELAHLVEHIAANNQPRIIDYGIPDTLTYYGSNAMTRPDYTSLWRTVSPDGLAAIVRSRANRVAGVRNDPSVFERQIERVAGELERAITGQNESGRSAVSALAGAFGVSASAEERLAMLRTYDTALVGSEISEYYRPDNAVLVVAGDIDLASTQADVRAVLETYPARAGPSPTVGRPFPAYPGPAIHEDTRVSATRVGLGFVAPDRSNYEDFLAFLIFDQWLLGGRSAERVDEAFTRAVESPLGRRLQSSLGIDAISDGRSYEYDPPRLALRSPSYLGAYFETSGSVPWDSIALLAREAYRDAVLDDLTDSAVAGAKTALVTFLGAWLLKPDLLSLGDMLAAFTMIDGDPTRLRSLPNAIRAVTADRVRALARSYLADGMIRIGIVHPP